MRNRAGPGSAEEGSRRGRAMIDSLLRVAGVYKAYEKYLNQQVKWGQMPEHIGIILDGNRRWATEKSLDATDGHWAGAKVGEQVLDWCLEYGIDRKSTRLNSSHQIISYAVFCLKKKKK